MHQNFFIFLLVFSVLIYKVCTEKYIVNDAKCKIPNITPLNNEVKDLMDPQPYHSCNKSELLTYITKNEDGCLILHLREDLIHQNLICTYCYVFRDGSEANPDVGIKITHCHHLHKQAVLEHDTVKVTCITEQKSIFYENVHNPIMIKDSIQSKIRDYKNSSKPFSVLFVVIDSISRLNFVRTMPKTYNFLHESGFIEMKGYTKVDDNTFPNCMALLAGMTLDQVDSICNPGIVGKLDNCSMIWYDYCDKGYITAYAEDDSPIATFNFNKKGFKDPPTDYYFKPYFEATETLTPFIINNMAYCTGPETAGERVLNLAKDFAITFKQQASFGVFWMNTFSHNNVSTPYRMDTKVKNFFVDIKNAGVLDESFVILLSDHGIRFGNIRTTRSGWLEVRMPTNMISVPKSFQKKFPSQYKNLKENSKKLTSTHDMFMTLQDILTLSGISHCTRQSLACPKCDSLFKKIATNRSCEDAGISPEWCTCQGHFEPIPTNNELVKNATNIALNKIASNHPSDSCSMAQILASSISESVSSDPDTKYLFLVLATKPESTFLVTVKFSQYVTFNSTFFIRKKY